MLITKLLNFKDVSKPSLFRTISVEEVLTIKLLTTPWPRKFELPALPVPNLR